MADKSSGTVKAVVLLDGYRWHEKTGDLDSPILDASKGDEITVSAKEFERSQQMTPRGLAKASDKDAAPAGTAPEIPNDLSELSDPELKAIASAKGAQNVDGMSRDELVAVVAAAPGGNERPNV